MTVKELRAAVEVASEDPTRLQEARGALEEVVDLLDQGKVRTAEQIDGVWTVNQWAKKALYLYSRLLGLGNIQVRGSTQTAVADRRAFEPFPLKAAERLSNVFMPVASVIRHGSFISDDVRLIHTYINWGSWVGPRTIIGIGASVGLCAQVGADVWISSGASVGSVMLLPFQARPVIVEDGVYIGMHCIISDGVDPYFDRPASTKDEGIVIGAGAVLGANVVLSGSTPLIDVTGSKPREIWGSVPARGVVIRGNTTRRYPAGDFAVATSLLVGWRNDEPDLQKSLHDALRKYVVEP